MQDQSLLSVFAPFVLIFGIMYFLIIRPQAKKQKELQKMRDSIKSGDEVVLSGGIYGKVAGIDAENNTVKVKIDSNCTVKVERSSISMINGVGGEVSK